MKIEVYRSGSKKDYFWRAKANNGRIIADGSEGYNNKADLIDSVMALLGLATLEAHGGEFASEPAAYTSTRTVNGTLETIRIEMNHE